jgi:hypothetical protein
MDHRLSGSRTAKAKEAAENSVLLKGTASEPVLSEAEGCRKFRTCNAALAAEVIF